MKLDYYLANDVDLSGETLDDIVRLLRQAKRKIQALRLDNAEIRSRLPPQNLDGTIVGYIFKDAP